MSILQKLNSQEVKSILRDAKFKVGTVLGTCAVALQTPAFAVDPVPADMTSVVASMTSTFTTVSGVCVSAVAAIAPVAVTIFGIMFVWKKGIKFFKTLTQG